MPEKVGQLGDRRFALILDEAHSSQSGKAAVKLREVLTTDGKVQAAEAQFDASAYEEAAAEVADLTGEDVINFEIAKLIAARKRPPNVSYYAFTATPKPKTAALLCATSSLSPPKPSLARMDLKIPVFFP